MNRIGVIDFKINNLKSIVDFLKRSQVNFSVISEKNEIPKCSKLILPGVGSFRQGMRSLTELGLVEEIGKFAKSGRHLLGICLGMQLFFESSEEFGFSTGLGLLNGDVKPIQALAGHRVHMGWNNLNVIRESRLISEKDSDLEVYFAHSFSCHPRDEKLVIATSDFGQGVTAIVEFENVMGVQFHPEKSQVLGSRILSRFRDLND